MKKPNWLSLAVISLVVIAFVAYVFWNKTNDDRSSIFSIEPTPTMSDNAKTPLYTPEPDATATASDKVAGTPEAQAQPTPVAAEKPIDNQTPPVVVATKSNPPQMTVVQSMPRTSAIRDEVRKNPHETPGSAIQFAMMIGEREKTALENEQDSKNLMTELEACGLTKDPELKNPSVQMVCLTTAREISEKWPSLKTRYGLLMKNADPTAVGLSKEIP